MARVQPATIVADGTYLVGYSALNRAGRMFEASLLFYGTFGSGTVTLFASPDGGTTKIAIIDDVTGAAFSITAATLRNIKLGLGNSASALAIYATVTGSTSPSLKIEMWDTNVQ